MGDGDKKPDGYVDREATMLPYIRTTTEGRVIPVRFGKIGWAFIFACLGMIASVTFLVVRVEAGEDDYEEVERDIKTLNSNIGILDEQQRATDQLVKFSVQQLQALLDASDVVGPTKLPELEESKLKDLE